MTKDCALKMSIFELSSGVNVILVYFNWLSSFIIWQMTEIVGPPCFFPPTNTVDRFTCWCLYKLLWIILLLGIQHSMEEVQASSNCITLHPEQKCFPSLRHGRDELWQKENSWHIKFVIQIRKSIVFGSQQGEPESRRGLFKFWTYRKQNWRIICLLF